MASGADVPDLVAPPALGDLEPPAIPTPAPALAGAPVPPQHRIYFYDPLEWELFIREWATGLDQTYVQIKRLGGSGDHGADVAAFKTDEGFEGSWDCFQGKHYAGALTWSRAFPEILKVFVSVIAGHYILPDLYAFLAPQGCGPSLNKLLSKPDELRTKFIEELRRHDGPAKDLDAKLRASVEELAAGTNFARFKSVELIDALEIHRRTPYHAARFGTPVPPRQPHADPPDEIGANEARYVAQLVEVYSEKEPSDTFVAATAASHAVFGQHFQRQRESFYSAEALRLYARDSVPAGTFEALQADVHAGVVEVADSSHPTGYDRLSSVLTASGQLDLSVHALVSVSRTEDRKGICHQLANEDRLTWVKES